MDGPAAGGEERFDMRRPESSRTSWLSFQDPRQEAEWQLEWAKAQGGLDVAFSLQTVLLPSLVARLLWHHLHTSGSLLTLHTLWLTAFLAWSPLMVLLAYLRPAAYLRYRTHLVIMSRLQRQLTILMHASRFHYEAMGAHCGLEAQSDGGSSIGSGIGGIGGVPSTLAGTLGMLLWQPGSMATLLVSHLLPLRYNAPCAALLLAATLHNTLRQCTAECRGSGQADMARLYAGAALRLRRLLRMDGKSNRSRFLFGALLGTPVSAQPTCGSDGLDPSSGAGSGAACSPDACRRTCLASHAWLQIVLGALLPLAASWALEERSRRRFQQRWLQRYAPADDPAAEPAPAPRTLPFVVLLVWLCACAWFVWVLLELLLLR